LFRQLAAEQGMDVVAFGRHAAAHPEVDVELDARMAARGRRGGVVLEGRLAGWVATREGLPALRVWVTCRDDVRAARVAQREGTDPAAALAANTARERTERDRYLGTYAIDLADTSIYDLVLDSTEADPATLVAALLAAVILRLRNRRYRAMYEEEHRDLDADGIPDAWDPVDDRPDRPSAEG
jgi:predicted cytidylate kinase